MAKNKGYTLVELIIVLAIMAVLAGLSFITIGIIRKAKCESAVTSFNNQIGSLLVKTKATSNAANGTDPQLCMVVKKRANGVYVIMTGCTNGSNVTAPDGSALDFNDDNKCEVVLPKDIVNIVYKPKANAVSAQSFSDDPLVIQFLKADGTTMYGGGTYELYKGSANSSELYATVYLDPVSGKHFVK